MCRSLSLAAALVFVLIASSVEAVGVMIGVYESETNAATYHGAYQAPLRDWLKRRGYQFDVIGDSTAADASKLARYAAVVTSSCYLVPDAACAGLRQYVADGGRLIWIDGPARCQNSDLLVTLGVEGRYTYAPMERAQFRRLAPDHLACAGIEDFTTRAVGNAAVNVTGEVLATWTGAIEGPPDAKLAKERTLPAVVVTKTGKGRAVLLNWIIWLGAKPQAHRLLGNVLEWALAGQLLKDRLCVVRLTGVPGEASQPQAIPCAVHVFGQSQLAGKPATLWVRLLNANGGSQGRPRRLSTTLSPSADGELSFAAAKTAIFTEGLPDGQYTAVVGGKVGGVEVAEARAGLALNAQALSRLQREQAARAKMLRLHLTRLLGDYDAEPRTKEGRVDIPLLLKQIEAAHMNLYDFLIWHAGTDWEDLQLFLPEARRRGLKVWVTLAPPSEPPPSAPFGLDYLKWADEIGKLSRHYDNVVGVVIDDFWSGENQALFTPSYIAGFAQTLRTHNPKVAFLPTIYWGTIGDTDFIKDYGASMDGIVFPYADLESTKDLRAQLEACRKWIGPNKLLFINVYATGSSGTAQKGPRTPEYMRSILTISREKCDGIRIYCLPKQDFADYRFAITAELYEKWGEGVLHHDRP